MFPRGGRGWGGGGGMRGRIRGGYSIGYGQYTHIKHAQYVGGKHGLYGVGILGNNGIGRNWSANNPLIKPGGEQHFPFLLVN